MATPSPSTTDSGSTSTPRTFPASFNPPGAAPVATTRLIDYGGSLEQALRDLMAWVEDGVDPPQESGYTLDDDQRLTLAPAPPRVAVCSRSCVPRPTAQSVRMSVRGPRCRSPWIAETPPGGGTITGVEWDFDGTGRFPFAHDGVDGSRRALELEVVHQFDESGTYFPCVRVTAHRDGDVTSPHCRLVNLGRVRVVVK